MGPSFIQNLRSLPEEPIGLISPTGKQLYRSENKNKNS